MKERFGIGILCCILFASMTYRLDAGIGFGNRDSSIVVTGGTFNVASSNFNVSGTISQGSSGSITGNAFNFNNGVLRFGDSEVLMTANFNPSGTDTINLNGSKSIWAEPGTVVKQINVSSTGNKIEGHLNVSNEITLANSSAELTLGIQNTLNKDITLNSGTLILGDNLCLADDVQINGAGTVNLNNYQLALGGYYSAATPWASDLTFQGATDLSLHGNVELTGNWTFEGTNVINGHGSIIDLSGGGQIIVSGATGVLYLNDVYIKGLATSGGGALTCDTDGGMIYCNNAIIELSGDYSTLLGNIIIQGETTFVLRTYDWTFDTLGVLTVNNSLWLDIDEDSPGQVKATNPLFSSFHMLDEDNVDANVALGYLVMGTNGIVREVTDRSKGLSWFALFLVSQTLIENVFLTTHTDLAPGDTIHIGASLIIDGGGTVITFSNQTDPQFIVDAGVEVTLQNITFARINYYTFLLGEGAIIRIGENVTFEFMDDIFFDVGQFILDETARSRANGVTFKLRGIGGKRKVTFDPDADIYPENPKYTGITESDRPDDFHYMMRLRNNTLSLQNIELAGLENIAYKSSAAIVLNGNSTVQMIKDTSLNFEVEGINNELSLFNDALQYSGSIAFLGDTAANALTIDFALPLLVGLDDDEDVVARRSAAGVTTGVPLFLLNGDPGIFLTADLQNAYGSATVIFPDPHVAIHNKNENAFVVDNNSFIHCFDLDILGSLIKQQSANFYHTESRLDGEIDTAFIRKPHISRPMTSYAKQYVSKKKARKKLRKKFEKKRKKKKKKKHAKKYKILRDVEFFGSQMTRDIKESLGDDLELPEAIDTKYRNSIAFGNAVAGNLEFDGASVTNFLNDYTFDRDRDTPTSDTEFNITMKNGATIEQSVDHDILLADNQYINVAKGDNKKNTIKVKKLFEVNDNFRLESGVDLTVKFVKSGIQEELPIFRLGIGMQLDIPQDAVLRFRGEGIVEIDHYVVINMKGTRAEESLDKSKNRLGYTSSNRPILDIGPDVKLRIRVGAGFITGVGEVICAGDIDPYGGILHLWPRSTDDIIMKFLPGGKMLVQNGSKITTGLGTGQFTFESNSSLQILDGELAINDKSTLPLVRSVYGDKLTRGYMKSFDIKGNAKLIFGSKGVLSWGLNQVFSLGEFVEMPAEFEGVFFEVGVEDGASFNLVTRTAFEDPSGVYRGFEDAKIQSKASNFFTLSSVRAADIAYFFVNTNTSLTNGSIEFETTSDQRKVRTAAGVTVDLQDGDVITGDQEVGTEVVINGRHSDGTSFAISQDGTVS